MRPASDNRVRDETAENKPQNMALTTKSGALWQMSRAEKDEGWTDEGHAFVGREVVRSTSATAQSVGPIYCWLPPTVEDCYEDEDGKPAPLFKVRFLVGELDGDVEDLDIRQVVESLVTESVLRPPEPPKPKPSKDAKPLLGGKFTSDNLDPSTGMIKDPVSGKLIDPTTGKEVMIDPNNPGVVIDPQTGEPVP